MNNNLISREALRKRTIEFRDRLKESGQLNLPSGFGAFLDFIKEAPAVDAVEVVRCKDCTHWYDREGVCLKIYSDGNVNADAWQERKAEDFCSYGERRADNGE